MSRVRRLAVVLRELALWVVAGLGTLCLLAVLASALFDVRPVVFQSGSMSPAIETGALAFARTTPADDLRVGDVAIVSASGGAEVAHRVKTIEHLDGQARVRLQGDANPAPDPDPYVVDSADVVLFDLPIAGRVLSLAGTSAGLLVLGTFSVLLLRIVVRRGSGPRGGGSGGSHRRGRHRDRPRKDPDRWRIRARSAAAAGAAVLMIGAGPVWAAPWTDPVSITVDVSAHYVDPPDSTSCSSPGTTAIVSWPQKNPLYDYEVSLKRSNGTTVSTREVTGSGLATTYSGANDFGLGLLALGTYTFTVEIRSYLAGSISWRSAAVRVSSQSIQVEVISLLFILSIGSVDCI